MKDSKVPKVEDEAVPAWFKSYMDKVRKNCSVVLNSESNSL